MSSISINIVNSNKNSLSTLSVNYIGYFYYVFPLHPNTFHWLFYTHTLPSIEKFKFEIYFFTSNISGIMNNQIKTLCQFKSTISQFQSTIDSEIEKLNSNISDISKFNSFVTKCVKSYLCKYITCISNYYNLSYKSLKENIETFKCIQKCVRSMLSLVNGDSGYEGYAKAVFSYVSNDNDNYVKNTITMIKNNIASQKLGSIDVYLTSIDKFLDASNDISKNTEDLGTLRNELSQFSGHITNYTNRIKWFLITRLDRLTRSEPTISRINNKNGIKDKYQTIKHKVVYCKSSLEYEVERLESISKNARMLQKHLELLIGMIKKYKTIEERLKELKYKLNRMKQNKKIAMDYLSRTVQMVICNLYDVNRISNSLDCAKDRVSIATIKQDLDNIYSRIKDINNILSIVKSHLESLLGLKLGIDCKLVNEIECCIKEIVSGIHSKYCSLSSELTTVFSPEPSSGLTLGGSCQLSGILECTCAPQASSQNCGSFQDCQGAQGCQLCECLKQLSTSYSKSEIGPKLESIKKVICRLIDGKKVQADSKCTTQNQECPHSCQNREGTQITSSCETSGQVQQTTNTYQTTTSQLIKCTLEVINKCQTSSKQPCESKDEVKCADPPSNSCQTTGGTQTTTSCSPTSSTGVVTCKDLDTVKLCVDNMVNKCNCCKLKESLSDKNIKSFVNLFSWLIISNFRELFCLYLCFDKSILDQILSSTQKLSDIKSFITNKSTIESIIKCRIDDIKIEIKESTKKVESLENNMKSGIRELECAIEGMARNLIRCSLQSKSIHHINGNISNHNMSFNNRNITCVI